MADSKDAVSVTEKKDDLAALDKKDKFRAAALEQKRLLKLIADSDHAAPELHKLKMHIAGLRCQVQDGSEATAVLRARMDTEKAEFEEIEKSRVKRLAYVLGGQKKKHEAKVEKEQREYLEVLGTYEAARAQFEELERTFEAAKKQRTELESLVTRHTELQNQVEELANSVFDGPSPEFPKDDEAEEEVKKAQTAYDELQATYFFEKKTVDGLTRARGLAVSALGHVRYAIKEAKVDIMVPASLQNANHVPYQVDYEQRAEWRIDRALRQAQEEVAEATVLANTTLADVGMTGVDAVKIPERHIVWNILLNCMFTDIVFREQLKDVEVEVDEFRNSLSAALDMFLPRHEALREQTQQRHHELIVKRQWLVDTRMKMLEQILEEGKP